MSRIPIGPVQIDTLDNQAVLDRISEFVRIGVCAHTVTLNSLMFNEALRDKELANVISNASLIIPDSSGIIWAARYLSGQNIERFTGIDLLHRICRMFAGSGSSIFLLGGAPQIADISAANLSKLYPGLKIAGTHDGYFTPDDEPAILKLISDAKPDALFVGLDMPRQELWIARNVQKLKASVVIGVGGSFDVISGKLKRAPEWMRALHIEWLFRLFLQPWRVKRMAGLPCFVFNVIRLKHIKATT